MKPRANLIALSLLLSLPSISCAMQVSMEQRMNAAEKKLEDITSRVQGLEKQMQDLVEAKENNKKNVIPLSEEQKERMESWFELGQNEYHQGRYDQARAYFQKVIGENQEAEKKLQKDSAKQLGDIFLCGKGNVEKDFVKACTYFVKVKDEHAPLWEQALLGYCAFLKEDYETAMKCFDALRVQDVNKWLKEWAEVRRAIVCLKSVPVEPDSESRQYKDAFDLLLPIANKAQDVKNPEAQALAWAYLGTLYCEGKGVAKDPVTALAFLQRAESQHESKVAQIVAQTTLGTMHRDGVGVKINPKQARKQYHAAIGQPESSWCILL